MMLPPDHELRMQRALLSLDGLSVGDAFGECFFCRERTARARIDGRINPPGTWRYTDDTAMALSIVRCLKGRGRIDVDQLAHAFANEYNREPFRGYGGMARRILYEIKKGASWRTMSKMAFDGEGSCGNGGAMRVAPLGAYFAGDSTRVVEEAKASAEVTHAHPDGQTGAIAVALAAAWMCTSYKPGAERAGEMLEYVLGQIPKTETFHVLKGALKIPLDATPEAAAAKLGNGIRVISSDTVPFCLWCAARHPNSYKEALWNAVSVGGDIDTNCAIIGGIVALSAGRHSIPAEWLQAREEIEVA